jgi:DNA-binding transcriptional MerR regulator
MRAQQLASVAGTTVRTIRYYHKRGLLAVPDGATGWRSYGFAHLTRLMRIRWLVESGIPLAEVPHMLRPPRSGDERTAVREDLEAVLSSIDQRIAVLGQQRARVTTLLDRVTSEDRLSPLPASIDRMYAALLERPLPPETVQAMTRERDLLELVCYQGALPEDVVALAADDVRRLSGRAAVRAGA